ncbi:S-adenosyl-L-methionine-dependent methyltransferase [Roridomyces roridus]|uniref:S-adenosyl-L-methionine-dependent methyltransferase n=1 Tax=Roridomyces roridus TaxID=1738132 RepID=A0AAD7BPV6_9AGAR|nr:S-adenosyl-L-methionine-dependent methyltransferase [Roridomyces roridus]
MPHTEYLLPSAGGNERETNRLDAIHKAFSAYFDGRLCGVDLAQGNLHNILDLGCGSGAWAIQAANEFPVAQIAAVDLSPLPVRPLPENLHFALADISQPMPFEPRTFDVVHSRLVMCHILTVSQVKDASKVISEAAQLIRPGGLLLIEDVDMKSLAETGGPSSSRCVSKMIELWRENGADFEVARKLQEIVQSTGYFANVEVQRINLPFGNTASGDERRQRLGHELKKGWQQLVMSAGERLATLYGLDEEMVRAHVQELDEVGSKASADLYICAARRCT